MRNVLPERMKKPIVTLENLTKHFDERVVLQNINLTVYDGEFLTLLGPSGSGKSTLLRLISGFEMPDSGRIFIKQKEVTKISPEKRPVHTVFQSYALFPHMTVYDNIAFGLRAKGLAKEEIAQRVHEVLKIVKLEAFTERKPNQLSGGQQQRVAIARAVVNKPLVLLLDEPLSALDYRLRKALQIELKQLQRTLGITFIFITHDQEEALSMSDRVAVLHEGRIEQLGTPREVYENPKNLTIAKFIGEVNIFDSTVKQVIGGHVKANIETLDFLLVNSHSFQMNDPIHVLVRPEDIRVWHPSEVTDTTGMLPGTVEEIIYKGTTVDLMVRLPSGKLIAASEFFDEDDEKLEYKIGESVWVNWLSGWEVVLPYES